MTKKPAVLLIGDFLVPGLTEALQAVYDLRYEPGPDIRAVVTHGGAGIDAASMARLPALELVAVCSVGYDKVDLAYARAHGIAVTNTPDVLTDDVADLAIALMLALYRRIPQQHRYVCAGGWASNGAPPLARRLSGRRIGILGLGRIGLAIARRAQPYGGEIAYHSRSQREDVPYRYAASAVELAHSVDIFIVATAGGSETAHLVDSRVIEAIGPDGALINIARGSVVDEKAMVDALVDGRLGGAGLDVFAAEPHVPDELLERDNVVLLPHQGSATLETRSAMGQLVLDNLSAHFAGMPLITPI